MFVFLTWVRRYSCFHCRYVSYVTVLDMVNQMHWYMPCHEWLKASVGRPEMLVVEPDTSWHWT